MAADILGVLEALKAANAMSGVQKQKLSFEQVSSIINKERMSTTELNDLTGSIDVVKQVLNSTKNIIEETNDHIEQETSNVQVLAEEIKDLSHSVSKLNDNVEQNTKKLSENELNDFMKTQAGEFKPLGGLDWINALKSKYSPSNLIQAKLDKSGGFFSEIIKRKIAENAYVKTRANVEDISGLSSKEQKEKLKQFRSDFKEIHIIRREIFKNEQEIEKARSLGLSEASIKAKYFGKREGLSEKLVKVSPRYAEQVAEITGENEYTKTSSADNTYTKAENVQEAQHLQNDQFKLFENIDLNLQEIHDFLLSPQQKEDESITDSNKKKEDSTSIFKSLLGGAGIASLLGEGGALAGISARLGDLLPVITAALPEVAAAIAAVSAVTAGIWELSKHWDEIKGSVGEAWNGVTDAAARDWQSHKEQFTDEYAPETQPRDPKKSGFQLFLDDIFEDDEPPKVQEPIENTPEGDDVYDAYDAILGNIIPENNSAESVYNQSFENDKNNQISINNAPTTIVNAPSTNQQIQNVNTNSGARNTESSYTAYNKSRFALA